MIHHQPYLPNISESIQCSWPPWLPLQSKSPLSSLGFLHQPPNRASSLSSYLLQPSFPHGSRNYVFFHVNMILSLSCFEPSNGFSCRIMSRSLTMICKILGNDLHPPHLLYLVSFLLLLCPSLGEVSFLLLTLTFHSHTSPLLLLSRMTLPKVSSWLVPYCHLDSNSNVTNHHPLATLSMNAVLFSSCYLW